MIWRSINLFDTRSESDTISNLFFGAPGPVIGIPPRLTKTQMMTYVKVVIPLQHGFP
jgi:hypothetical protein